MTPDFTLAAYRRALAAAHDAGYRTMAVIDWFDGAGADADAALVLRHDVDRRPKNALAMAAMEAAMGVRSSYYFRMVPVSFVPPIIEEIAGLGHEIGYHYEDWDRAKGDPDRAMALFGEALEKLRAIAPVRTMCMHGSPLARENNMTLNTSRRHVIATLSNGNVALLVNMAKHARLPWDAVLSAELFHHYKPDPEVYRSAADFLDLSTAEVMMVAAHLGDLRAAKAVGLRTAFVARPDEYGHGPNNRKADLAPDSSVDLTARDFGDLATRLGA